MKFRRLMRMILVIMVLIVASGVAGFLNFVHAVQEYHEFPINDQMEATDAVVVLTGGSERLAEGLNLLRAQKAKKLLVSGVHPSVKGNALLAQTDMTPEIKECCIILGRTADNTIGNAFETQTFMKAEGYHTLRLVTANYHMPRSLLLFRRIVPDVTIVPQPVSPNAVQLDTWWCHFGTFGLLAQEYFKYIYAWLMLSAL